MESNNQSSLDEKKKQKKPSSGSAGLVILRLLLTVILAVILGAVVYYSAIGGIPYLNKNIFQPIEENQSQVFELQDTQKALETEISAELYNAEQSGIQATLSAIDRNLQNLAKDLSSAQVTLDINSQINTHISTIYPQMIFDLEEKQESTSRNLSALATAQMGSMNTKGDLVLLRILDQLSRANQFLLHSNFGLAKDILILAQEDLTQLHQSSYSYQREYLDQIIDLVDGAISDLPSKPSLAEEKLELAWKLCLTGLPNLAQVEPSKTLTQTPYQPEFTPSPTAP